MKKGYYGYGNSTPASSRVNKLIKLGFGYQSMAFAVEKAKNSKNDCNIRISKNVMSLIGDDLIELLTRRLDEIDQKLEGLDL